MGSSEGPMTQPQFGAAPELGARLRDLRLEVGAKQREVAAALGLGVSSISAYEKGTAPPDARLADYAAFITARRVPGEDNSPLSQRLQKELLGKG